MVPNKEKQDVFSDLKDLYEESLIGDGASWQSARAFLPQSYSHSYYFAQNLLAISNSLKSFKEFYIENESQTKYKKYILEHFYESFITDAISVKFPLMGKYLHSLFTDNPGEFVNVIENLTYDQLDIKDKHYFEAI